MLTPDVLSAIPTIVTLADPLTAVQLSVAVDGYHSALGADDTIRARAHASRVHHLLACTWRYYNHRTTTGAEVLTALVSPSTLARMLSARALQGE